jgi:glycosyltransferase involved in cell wall biosynthesis
MEIIWITENYYPNQGGMAQSCDRIVNGLRKAGNIVHLLHFSNRHPKILTQNQWNGNYWAIPITENYPHALQIAYQILEKNVKKNEILVAFGGFLPILCIRTYSIWLNLPYFVCIRGNDFDVAIFHYQRKAILLDALNHAQKIITNTSNKALKINKLIQCEKAIFIPNGIEEEWRFSLYEQDWAYHYQKKYRPRKILGMFGQLKEKKGTLFLLDAIAQAHLNEHFHMIIAGETDENVLQFLDNQNFSYEKLDFIERYALIKYYLACDWIAIPSFYDGMPNVLLEAMALGTPVLASAVDGMQDVIIHEQNGLLFQNLNASDLILQLQKILDMQLPEYENFKKNAEITARNQFTLQNEIQQFMKALKI